MCQKKTHWYAFTVSFLPINPHYVDLFIDANTISQTPTEYEAINGAQRNPDLFVKLMASDRQLELKP